MLKLQDITGLCKLTWAWRIYEWNCRAWLSILQCAEKGPSNQGGPSLSALHIYLHTEFIQSHLQGLSPGWEGDKWHSSSQPTAGTLWPPLWACDSLFGLILKPLWHWNHWCHTWAEPELRNSSFLFCFSFLFACRAPAKQIPGSKFGMDRCEKRHNLVREVNFEDNHSAWLTKNPPTGHNTLWDNRDTFYCLLKQGVFWSPGSCDWCGFCSHANKAFNPLL